MSIEGANNTECTVKGETSYEVDSSLNIHSNREVISIENTEQNGEIIGARDNTVICQQTNENISSNQTGDQNVNEFEGNKEKLVVVLPKEDKSGDLKDSDCKSESLVGSDKEEILKGNQLQEKEQIIESCEQNDTTQNINDVLSQKEHDKSPDEAEVISNDNALGRNGDNDDVKSVNSANENTEKSRNNSDIEVNKVEAEEEPISCEKEEKGEILANSTKSEDIDNQINGTESEAVTENLETNNDVADFKHNTETSYETELNKQIKHNLETEKDTFDEKSDFNDSIKSEIPDENAVNVNNSSETNNEICGEGNLNTENTGEACKEKEEDILANKSKNHTDCSTEKSITFNTFNDVEKEPSGDTEPTTQEKTQTENKENQQKENTDQQFDEDEEAAVQKELEKLYENILTGDNTSEVRVSSAPESTHESDRGYSTDLVIKTEIEDGDDVYEDDFEEVDQIEKDSKTITESENLAEKDTENTVDDSPKQSHFDQLENDIQNAKVNWENSVKEGKDETGGNKTDEDKIIDDTEFKEVIKDISDLPRDSDSDIDTSVVILEGEGTPRVVLSAVPDRPPSSEPDQDDYKDQTKETDDIEDIAKTDRTEAVVSNDLSEVVENEGSQKTDNIEAVFENDTSELVENEGSQKTDNTKGVVENDTIEVVENEESQNTNNSTAVVVNETSEVVESERSQETEQETKEQGETEEMDAQKEEENIETTNDNKTEDSGLDVQEANTEKTFETDENADTDRDDFYDNDGGEQKTRIDKEQKDKGVLDKDETEPDVKIKEDTKPANNEQNAKQDAPKKEPEKTEEQIALERIVQKEESPLDQLLKRHVEIDGSVESISDLENAVTSLLGSMKQVMIHYQERLKLQALKDFTVDLGKFRGDFNSINDAYKRCTAMSVTVNQQLKELRVLTSDVRSQISRKFQNEDLNTWVDTTPEQEKGKTH